MSELGKRKRDGGECVVKTLPVAKMGRPLLLGEDLDKKVQNYLFSLRDVGGVINRAATRDITNVMKSLPWGKTVRASYGREYFQPCMSVKALVNANMIAGREKESTTKKSKSTASRVWVILGELLWIINIF